MSELSKFCKKIIARLTGDNATVIALKNEKKAKAAFNNQIAALRSKIVDLEEKMDDCQENFNNAVHIDTSITDGKEYLSNIVRCKKELDTAKLNLQNTKEDLEFFIKLQNEAFETDSEQ